MSKQRIGFAFLVLASLSLMVSAWVGCAWRDPNVRKQKYYQSALRYFDKGQYREASLQLQNALRIDPKYADAHYQLARCDIKLGRWEQVFAELNRTVDLAPRNWEAQIDLGNVLFAGRQFARAEDKANLVLAAEPKNVDAHTLLAKALAALGDSQGSLEEMQKAVGLDAARSISYIDLALLQVNAKQMPAAEESFRKAIALDAKSPMPHMALGAFYSGQHRFPEAAEQFQTAIAVDPTNPAPRSALARVDLAEGKEADAVEVLRQAKLAMPGNSAGYRMLADFYVETGKTDKALEEFASLHRDHPTDLEVGNDYVRLLIAAHRLDDATALNDQILKENPRSTEATFNRGQIWLRQGRARDAIPLLQTALQADSKNAYGHYCLGLAYAQTSAMDQARREWMQAVALRPKLEPAQEALAQLGLQQGDLDQAQSSAEALIAAQPTSARGYEYRAQVELRRRDAAAAEADLRKAKELAPNDPRVYTLLGQLRESQNKFQEAETFFNQALGIDPGFSAALGGLLHTYVQEKKPADAMIRRIQQQIALAPNNSAYELMLGQAFYSQRDYERAQAALERAVELDQNNGNALLTLADAQAERGLLPQAIATAQKAIKQNPRDLRGYAALGVLQEKSGSWQQAQDTYRQALQIDPQFGIGANNLANLLLDHGGDVNVALTLAQTARHSLPDSPSTADTLAWAYIQEGVYQSAIDLLQQALTKAPNNPNYRYHLGVAFERTKEPAAAADQFRQVLKLDPGYVKAEEIRHYLADTHKG